MPDLLPKLQSEPKCICGVSGGLRGMLDLEVKGLGHAAVASGYEEIQLRAQSWPGDQGVGALADRRPAFIHSIPETPDAWSEARVMERSCVVCGV